MAGTGDRFLQRGYKEPKPLIDVAGRLLIERLLEKFPRDAQYVFIVNQDHLPKFPLRETLLKLRPQAKIVPIAAHKRGPVHTVLEAENAIADDLPTIVNYCDFSFVWDCDHFLNTVCRNDCAGAVLCYRGFHPHYLGNTLYAYCREKEGRILEIKEKGHFTPDRTEEYASSGTYYFGSGELVKKYFHRAIDEKLEMNGEYYVSLVYNPMIRDGLKCSVYEIPYFLQWGTPDDLEDYVYWHKTFRRWARWEGKEPKRSPRLVIPMAGAGSRFKDSSLPKPLISVQGEPMFLKAKRFLPVAQPRPPVLIVRDEIRDVVQHASPSAQLISLNALTEGQAMTTRKALSVLDPNEPVLVSACDHGLLWDEAAWDALLDQNPDVVTVGQRGYPGARRTPKSYSYIDAAADGRIRRVSTKVPLSDRPEQDLLLVGTFYFQSAKLMGELIDELADRNIRVNGELYLDSVVGLAAERGLDVRCFESQAYMNWGSPEALMEFNYWFGYFQGVRA